MGIIERLPLKAVHPLNGSVKILLIEDSERIRNSLCRLFRQESFLCDSTGDGAEGLWFGLNHSYDVAVLDIMLPSLDGLSILQQWRKGGVGMPVLLLTAKGSIPDRVRGFRLGADDYLIKPFAVEELLERIRVLGRRRNESVGDVLSVGPLKMDTRERTAHVGSMRIHFTPKEFRLLEVLLRNRGRVMARQDIEQYIFDYLSDPSSNVVDVTVASVRRKIKEAGGGHLLHTRRGFGYVIPEVL